MSGKLAANSGDQQEAPSAPAASNGGNPSADSQEREADRIADRVVSASGRGDRLASAVAPSIGAAPRGVARKAVAGSVATDKTPADSSSRNVGLGAGRALPDSERAFFEARFGRSFGAVRIHTDADAARAAHRMSARAFTFGNDIAFANGEYRPGTTEGRRLLAHELTHTIQQRRGGARHIQRQQAPGRIPTHPLDAVFLNGTRVRRYADGKVMYVETVLPPGVLQDIIWAPESHTGSSSAGIRRTIASHPGTAGGFDRDRLTVVRAAYIGRGRFNFADGHTWNVDPRVPGEAFSIRSRADRYGQAFTDVNFRGQSKNRPARGGERAMVNIGYYVTRTGQPGGMGRLQYVERYDFLDPNIYHGSIQGGPGNWTWNRNARPPEGHGGRGWRAVLNERITPRNPAGFHELINVDADGNFDDSDRPFRDP